MTNVTVFISSCTSEYLKQKRRVDSRNALVFFSLAYDCYYYNALRNVYHSDLNLVLASLHTPYRDEAKEKSIWREFCVFSC